MRINGTEEYEPYPFGRFASLSWTKVNLATLPARKMQQPTLLHWVPSMYLIFKRSTACLRKIASMALRRPLELLLWLLSETVHDLVMQAVLRCTHSQAHREIVFPKRSLLLCCYKSQVSPAYLHLLQRDTLSSPCPTKKVHRSRGNLCTYSPWNIRMCQLPSSY